MALDFGSGQISAALAAYDERTGTCRVRHALQMPCPSVSACYILDFDQTVHTLRRMLQEVQPYAPVNPTVCVGLRGDFLAFRRSGGFLAVTGKNQLITEREVRAALDQSVPAHLSDTLEVVDLLPQTFTLDGKTGIQNPVGLAANCLEAETFISTAPKTHLQNLNRVMEAVGLEDFEAVPSVLALCDTLVKPEEKQASTLLLDVGAQHSSAALYHKGLLEAAWEMPLGADLITRELADVLQNEVAEARQVLRDYTYGDDEILDEVLDESAVKLIKSLHHEWTQHLSYVKYPPSQLVLTGGGADLPVKNVAKQVLGVRRARTAAHDELIADAAEWLAPAYTSALSLLLYSQRHGDRATAAEQAAPAGLWGRLLSKLGLE